VNVAVPEALLAESDWNAVRKRFHAQHDRLYGYSLEEEGTRVELLNVRLSAVGVTKKPPLERQPRRAPSPRHALKGSRPVFFFRFQKTPVNDGDRLVHGNRIQGPAIIESVNTTIVVPPRYTAQYDAHGNCVLSA
jgi:N-methylhydantoinase A